MVPGPDAIEVPDLKRREPLQQFVFGNRFRTKSGDGEGGSVQERAKILANDADGSALTNSIGRSPATGFASEIRQMAIQRSGPLDQTFDVSAEIRQQPHRQVREQRLAHYFEG